MIRHLSVFAVLMLLLALAGSCQQDVAAPPHADAIDDAKIDDAKIDVRIEALLKQMTLEEKLGQLNQFSYGRATGPSSRVRFRADGHRRADRIVPESRRPAKPTSFSASRSSGRA